VLQYRSSLLAASADATEQVRGFHTDISRAYINKGVAVLERASVPTLFQFADCVRADGIPNVVEDEFEDVSCEAIDIASLEFVQNYAPLISKDVSCLDSSNYFGSTRGARRMLHGWISKQVFLQWMAT